MQLGRRGEAAAQLVRAKQGSRCVGGGATEPAADREALDEVGAEARHCKAAAVTRRELLAVESERPHDRVCLIHRQLRQLRGRRAELDILLDGLSRPRGPDDASRGAAVAGDPSEAECVADVDRLEEAGAVVEAVIVPPEDAQEEAQPRRSEKLELEAAGAGGRDHARLNSRRRREEGDEREAGWSHS